MFLGVYLACAHYYTYWGPIFGYPKVLRHVSVKITHFAFLRILLRKNRYCFGAKNAKNRRFEEWPWLVHAITHIGVLFSGTQGYLHVSLQISHFEIFTHFTTQNRYFWAKKQ